MQRGTLAGLDQFQVTEQAMYEVRVRASWVGCFTHARRAASSKSLVFQSHPSPRAEAHGNADSDQGRSGLPNVMDREQPAARASWLPA
jgi:hypothetical protein